MREGSWRTPAVYARSTLITAAWSAALAYFKISNENAKKTRHWDLWSWTCEARESQDEIPWNSLCTEMVWMILDHTIAGKF